MEAWGPNTQVQPSPRLRRVREMTQAEQTAAVEEARLRLNAKDAAEAAAVAAEKEAAAKRPSRGNVVAYDKWKENPQDHPEYVKLAADAAAANEERQRLRNDRLGPEIGPSDKSIREGKDDARARENAKLTTPQPPSTSSTNPRMPSGTLKPFDGSRGGNKQRTRKRQRIASTHHHTKRRILRNKNHKHTRKARQVRASGSV